MDPLELLLDSLDNLDAAFHPLYTEKDGKFHLTAIKGMVSPDQVKALRDEAGKYRIELKDVNDKLAKYAVFGDDVEAIHSKLDRFDELETAAAGKIDEDKINEMVENRMKTKLAPLQRELEQSQKDGLEKDGLIGEFKTEKRNRSISDVVREAATKSNIVGSAVADVLALAERVFDVDDQGNVTTKDGMGTTPGVDPDVWLTDMQVSRGHWWPANQGGGAGGSGNNNGGAFANNPFSNENWNMTEQGKLLRVDAKKADDMAKAAGTTVGGRKPDPKK